jgi:beta-glucosidase
MAFEFYPEALEGTIRRAWMKTDGLPVPVLVPENGVGTDDDEARFEYVSRALARVGCRIDDGIDVPGYT